jgi:integrase
VGECCRLTVDNIELASGGRVRLTIRTSKARDGRWRTVTLPRQAAQLVRDYLDHDRPRFWVFPGRRNEHLCVRSAQRITVGYLRQIGAGHLHTHSLRHSYASIAVRETRNIFAVSKLLGHADVRTTSALYCHFDPSDADAAADAVAEAMSRRGRAR